MERKQLIFKKGIRYTIYVLYIIGSIIGMNESFTPEGIKLQVIGVAIVILCFGMMVHHTNMFKGN